MYTALYDSRYDCLAFQLPSIPLAPLWLMTPGHPFTLPEDAEVHGAEQDGSLSHHGLPTSSVPAVCLGGSESETRTEPIAVLSRRLAETNIGPRPMHDAEMSGGDKLSGSVLGPGGLSQPPDNPLLLLSSADSAQVGHVTSSQEPTELADAGFDEAVKDLCKRISLI